MIWPQTKWTIIVNFTFKKINSGEPFGPAQWLDHKSNGKSLRLKSGKRFLRVLMSWAMFLTNPPPEFTFSSSLSISCLASLVIAMMSNQRISYDFLELQYTQTSWIVFKWCDGEQLASGCLHIGQAISKTFGILTQLQLLHIYMSRPILNLEGFKKSVCCEDFRKVRFAICFYVTSNCSNQVAWTSNQELITNLHILIKKMHVVKSTLQASRCSNFKYSMHHPSHLYFPWRYSLSLQYATKTLLIPTISCCRGRQVLGCLADHPFSLACRPHTSP